MIEILKVDDKGEVLLPVYRADAPGADRQGDVISGPDLYAAMTRWVVKRELRLQHDKELPAGLVTVLGCFMTGKAYRGDGYSIGPLTWCLHLKIDLEQQQGQEIWAHLKDGQLQGLSLAGSATVESFIADSTGGEE